MKLYGLKACDTCQKARKALEGAGKIVEFVDVRTDGLAPDTLREFHAAFGDDLINRRSTTWRELPEDARSGDPIELLLRNPAVMKRPVIRTGQGLHLGWGRTVQDAVLR